MTLIEFISLFAIMMTLALLPSSSVALVVSRSAVLGVANGIAVAFGIVIGDLVFILLAAFGMAYIAETLGWLFLIIKYIGAAYLICLGFSLLKETKHTVITLNDNEKPGNLLTSFLAGLFLTLGDIKAIFFYVSLLPTFIDLKTLSLSDVFMLMLVTVLTVGGVKICYAFSATKLIAISKVINLETHLKKVTGTLMLGVGGYLIVKT